MKDWLKAIPLMWLLLATPATAAPTVTEFPLPTAAAQPQDLVLGPDGNINPTGITIGPNAAVWYAEAFADAVGRIDATGSTSHVTGLAANSIPRYVSGGPGDSPWFTEEVGNSVGRITGIPLPQPLPQPQPQPDTTKLNVTGLRLSRKVVPCSWARHRSSGGGCRRTPRSRSGLRGAWMGASGLFAGRCASSRPPARTGFASGAALTSSIR